jgi:hypothetical protein
MGHLESADPAVWAESHAWSLFVAGQLFAHTAGSAESKWPVDFLFQLNFVILYFIYMVHSWCQI